MTPPCFVPGSSTTVHTSSHCACHSSGLKCMAYPNEGSSSIIRQDCMRWPDDLYSMQFQGKIPGDC